MPGSVRFCPIASGSSGNCVYYGAGERHFLIDVGLSGKAVNQCLSHFRIPNIDAIFITHEHTDHIKGLGVLMKRFRIPVYAAPKTWRFILRHRLAGVIDESLARTIIPGKPAEIFGVTVEAFDVPHDASQPVGYSFQAANVKATVATDIGHITETVLKSIRGSDVVLIESNHDVELLMNGRYPRPLKERVIGERGHLSNINAGVLLSLTATENLRHAFLGHLSEENNRPLIALDTVQSVLDENRIIVRNLTVADRYAPSEFVEL